MTITKVEDVKNRWVGDWIEDTGVSDAQIEIFIEDLENQISREIPNFVVNVLADNPNQKTVSSLVTQAIHEFVIFRLSPYESESQNNPDFSRSIRNSSRTRSKLELTDPEIAKLKPIESRDGEAFMVIMGSRGKVIAHERLF